MPSSSSTLWVVATPIGNNGDFSPRARQILAEADLVLAEDTRRAGLLLSQCGVKAQRLLSFFEHNEDVRQEQVLAVLRQGGNVALITDAGTPLLADPGFRLVRACRRAGLNVAPVPGPSAPLAALSAAGIAPIPFTFLGFLPRSAKARRDLFALFGAAPATLVFFERKDRLAESLALAHALLGSRELAICREITKTHEEFIFGDLSDGAALAQNLLGEITVIIGAPQGDARAPLSQVQKIIAELRAQGHSAKNCTRAARPLAKGWTMAELYKLASGPGGDS